MKVQLPGKGFLSLAEVEVYGELITDELIQNIAKGKPTKQSGDFSSAFGLSKNAVDGNTDGNWDGRSVTHTRYGKYPWWEVDLQDDFSIHFVKVYNRKDCCGDRLNNFNLIITNGGEETFRYSHQGAAQLVTTIDVPADVRGDKVKVQLPGIGFLSLAEVEVFGEKNEIPQE